MVSRINLDARNAGQNDDLPLHSLLQPRRMHAATCRGSAAPFRTACACSEPSRRLGKPPLSRLPARSAAILTRCFHAGELPHTGLAPISFVTQLVLHNFLLLIRYYAIQSCYNNTTLTCVLGHAHIYIHHTRSRKKMRLTETPR